MYGELIPQGGGDPIPLRKETLKIGRRENCDIVLRFNDVWGTHCELTLNGGYWFVKDLNSRNGIKVNGARVQEKRLDPGDILRIAKHNYEVKYSPVDNGAFGPPPPDRSEEDIFTKSLLERAGLSKTQFGREPAKSDHFGDTRYDITKDEPDEQRKGHEAI
jgi:pSer/pThr/pTyr-binding forkhead associated (FHA) protein